MRRTLPSTADVTSTVSLAWHRWNVGGGTGVVFWRDPAAAFLLLCFGMVFLLCMDAGVIRISPAPQKCKRGSRATKMQVHTHPEWPSTHVVLDVRECPRIFQMLTELTCGGRGSEAGIEYNPRLGGFVMTLEFYRQLRARLTSATSLFDLMGLLPTTGLGSVGRGPPAPPVAAAAPVVEVVDVANNNNQPPPPTRRSVHTQCEAQQQRTVSTQTESGTGGISDPGVRERATAGVPPLPSFPPPTLPPEQPDLLTEETVADDHFDAIDGGGIIDHVPHNATAAAPTTRQAPTTVTFSPYRRYHQPPQPPAPTQRDDDDTSSLYRRPTPIEGRLVTLGMTGQHRLPMQSSMVGVPVGKRKRSLMENDSMLPQQPPQDDTESGTSDFHCIHLQAGPQTRLAAWGAALEVPEVAGRVVILRPPQDAATRPEGML